jgi:hypothetical protein
MHAAVTPSAVPATRRRLPSRARPAGVGLIGGGSMPPCRRAPFTIASGAWSEAGSLAAGMPIVAGQCYATWLGIIAADDLRPVTLENLSLSRRVS